MRSREVFRKRKWKEIKKMIERERENEKRLDKLHLRDLRENLS